MRKDVFQQTDLLGVSTVSFISVITLPLLTSHSDDDRAEPAIASQRQAQSLLIFVDNAVQGSSSLSASDSAQYQGSELLSLVLDLANPKKRKEVPTITNAARAVVKSVLGSMAAVEFVDGVQTVLQAGENSVRIPIFDPYVL